MGMHPPRRSLRLSSVTGVMGRALVLLGLLASLASMHITALAQTPVSNDGDGGDGLVRVTIIPIEGTIEPGMGHYLSRSIDAAEADGATAIVLDISTPGGRLDTVLEMRDAIMATEVPVIAFVNREAFSAGALITIASDTIYMAPGAVYGAATPVMGGTGETADAKTVSAVRATFRATAEEQGRDPAVAEAMVDASVTIDGLDSSTSLLTLTVEQAREVGYLDGVADSREALLDDLGLGAASVSVASPTFMERATSVITNPIVASLLILLGIALIVADGFVGGLGIVALFGVGCLALFFWGHNIAGLAGWEDVVLVGVGLALIAVEIFVVPGFGIPGIAGTLALVGGLVLAMTSRGFGDDGFGVEAGGVLTSLLVTLALTVVAIILFSWALPRLVPPLAKAPRGPQRLTLSATVARGGRPAPRPGFFVRMLGGGGVLERDSAGHTALERDTRVDADRPRDIGTR